MPKPGTPLLRMPRTTRRGATYRRPDRPRRTRRAIAVIGVVGSLVATTAPAHGAGPTVLGAGSTFAATPITQWAADVAPRGLSINYSSRGSTDGRNNFTVEKIDFASSDIAYRFTSKGEPMPGFSFSYVPLVAGGTALMYNLKDRLGQPITDLRLSPRTIMRIMSEMDLASEKEIVWNDPMIVADNPHLAGRLPPDVQVRPVVRADGSGTTAVFTNYLLANDPEGWNALVNHSNSGLSGGKCYVDLPCDKWPVPGIKKNGSSPSTLAVNGSLAVAESIKNASSQANGSIGYAEVSYAQELGIPVVAVRNAGGNYTKPTARSVAIALTQASRNRYPETTADPYGEGTYNLSKVFIYDHPEAYTISSYNYIIVPTQPHGDFNEAKGSVLGQWLLYSITDGQRKAAAMGYSPLPTNLIAQGFEQLNKIPGGPQPPPDPSVWGRFYESLKVDEALANPQANPQGATGPAGTSGKGRPGSGTGSGSDGAAATGTGSAKASAGARTATGASGRIATNGGSSSQQALEEAGTPDGVALGLQPDDGDSSDITDERPPALSATMATKMVADLKDRSAASLVAYVLGITLILAIVVPPTAILVSGYYRRRSLRTETAFNAARVK